MNGFPDLKRKWNKAFPSKRKGNDKYMHFPSKNLCQSLDKRITENKEKKPNASIDEKGV